MKTIFKIYPINNSPGYMLNRMSRDLNVFLQREFHANGFEITAQQWAILSTLWETNGLHQSQIADKTTKNRHNVSDMLKLLEKQGLITRKKDSADRRLIKVYLSDRGKELQGKLTKIASSAVDKIFHGLDLEDAKNLKRIYNKVVSNLAEKNTR